MSNNYNTNKRVYRYRRPNNNQFTHPLNIVQIKFPLDSPIHINLPRYKKMMKSHVGILPRLDKSRGTRNKYRIATKPSTKPDPVNLSIHLKENATPKNRNIIPLLYVPVFLMERENCQKVIQKVFSLRILN